MFPIFTLPIRHWSPPTKRNQARPSNDGGRHRKNRYANLLSSEQRGTSGQRRKLRHDSSR